MRKLVFILMLVSGLAWAADDYFDRWSGGPVKLIMTEDEAKDFRKLQTPEGKLTFMRIFWARRDPNPDSVINEFRTEFERRVAYANQSFAAGTLPGWQTPMGQAYIIFGPPQRTEPKILDGRRAILWWYQKFRVKGVDLNPNEAFAFIDLYGDGKLYLLPPAPKYDSEFDWDLRRAEIRASSQFALPNDYTVAASFIDDHAITRPDINYSELMLTGTVTTEYQVRLMTFTWNASVERSAEGRRTEVLRVRIPFKEMSFADTEKGQVKATMVLRVTLFDAKGGRVFGTDQPVAVAKRKDELSGIAGDAHDQEVRFPAPEPGRYRLELILEDAVTSRVGYISQEFEVPAGEPVSQ